MRLILLPRICSLAMLSQPSPQTQLLLRMPLTKMYALVLLETNTGLTELSITVLLPAWTVNIVLSVLEQSTVRLCIYIYPQTLLSDSF